MYVTLLVCVQKEWIDRNDTVCAHQLKVMCLIQFILDLKEQNFPIETTS